MMHGHRHGRRRRGCGHGLDPRRGMNREQWLARLEEHQKDLEQRIADVADLIRRLREEPAPPTAV
jgi:hypothetical protein